MLPANGDTVGDLRRQSDDEVLVITDDDVKRSNVIRDESQISVGPPPTRGAATAGTAADTPIPATPELHHVALHHEEEPSDDTAATIQLDSEDDDSDSDTTISDPDLAMLQAQSNELGQSAEHLTEPMEPLQAAENAITSDHDTNSSAATIPPLQAAPSEAPLSSAPQPSANGAGPSDTGSTRTPNPPRTPHPYEYEALRAVAERKAVRRLRDAPHESLTVVPTWSPQTNIADFFAGTGAFEGLSPAVVEDLGRSRFLLADRLFWGGYGLSVQENLVEIDDIRRQFPNLS
ncbi:hypothetical protein K490DRAFT_53584 [Saccharata proteae CBS 121410]|uniref:Uncharacterized protein n=1 Tax=Saccharata proteae CBS 121410 TaxID=1314787 RepID=A0A9P4LYR8_9PEZI|nr:hypothetical protein K490DRAFT_53584 [Saccharata proteae CBS 121410]